jgi:regulator of RNase E activity RraA
MSQQKDIDKPLTSGNQRKGDTTQSLEWRNDDELFGLVTTELFTAVIGDICDVHGLRRQFIDPRIHCVMRERPVPIMVGRAMPVLEADVFSEPEDGQPFGKMLEALDDLRPGEVYVCSGASPRYALVGELMATAMQARGARGAVCDGYVRDLEGLQSVGLPVYGLGSYAQDQRGRGKVLDYRVPVEIAGVSVKEGDLIVGDADGVMVIPREREAEVITGALEKARAEKTVLKAIQGGMGASEAFRTYGIL